jgi:predicted secreted hydrolase
MKRNQQGQQSYHRCGGAALLMLLVPLVLILSSCSFPGIVSSSAQLPPAPQPQQAAPLPPIRFPQDEAAHEDLTEWWYYTGHLSATDTSGHLHRYGFELVIFQILRSDLPPVYAAHYAISDITRGEFHFAQQRVTEPNAVIPNSSSTAGIDEHVGDWSITGVNGSDTLVASMPNYAIHLNLSGLKPATLHNRNGLISLGVAGFSYYYSRTRMAVSGTLIDHNLPLTVTGLAWMDHQWGNFLALGGGGWDWFSVQLSNNTELMLYFIHDASGKTVSTYADYVDGNGNDTLIPVSAIQSTVLGHWTSPTTHAVYPSGWDLAIDAPQVRLALTLTPLLKDQELTAYQSTGSSYWEGDVNIQGQANGLPVQGEGYVELTGYAH